MFFGKVMWGKPLRWLHADLAEAQVKNKKAVQVIETSLFLLNKELEINSSEHVRNATVALGQLKLWLQNDKWGREILKNDGIL